MSLQNFTLDSIKKIRSAVGMDPVLNPMQEAPLTNRGLNAIREDITSFAKVTPAGDLYRRAKYAREKRVPPQLSPQDYVNALKVLGAMARPDLAAFGVLSGTAGKAIENRMYGIPSESGAVDAGLENASNLVLLSPFLRRELQPITSEANKWIKMNYFDLAARRAAEAMGKK